MPNPILDDYLDAVKRQMRHLPLREQRQVLGEIRAHLDEDIAHRQEQDKALSRDEATLQDAQTTTRTDSFQRHRMRHLRPTPALLAQGNLVHPVHLRRLRRRDASRGLRVP